MADEAFHEIQLNGKQLVFLFMAATVVAVVIFLCGVMVGRGVRTNQTRESAALAVEAGFDPTARPEPAAGVSGDTAVSGDNSPSVATDEDLSYPERLAQSSSTPETLSQRSAASPPASATPAEALPARGDAFTVQVAAVKERGEADRIAGRLTKKGYAAYVMSPAAGAPKVYRVRVGKFTERRDAESIAAQLEREEQFKPWITR